MKKIKLKRFVITVVIMLACYLISISGTGICEAESAVDCDSCLWFYARAENRNVDRIFFGTSDRYSVWNGAGAVCTDLSDDRLCEWPVQ